MCVCLAGSSLLQLLMEQTARTMAVTAPPHGDRAAAALEAPPSSGKRTIRRSQRYIKEEEQEQEQQVNEEDSTGGGDDVEVDGWGDLELVKCPSHFCDTCHDIYVSPSPLRPLPGQCLICTACSLGQ